MVYWESTDFLITSMQLYKPLCQSICPLVGPLVGQKLFARSTQLMAIGLVYGKVKGSKLDSDICFFFMNKAGWDPQVSVW